jgi:hypothetical protein
MDELTHSDNELEESGDGDDGKGIREAANERTG